MSEEEKRARADAVIENAGSLDELYNTLDRLLAGMVHDIPERM
jgi:dephospho-CoA kinase